MKLPYGRQSIDETDIANVCDVLQSDYLTTGPAVSQFESKLCEVTGAKHAIACANGTAALHLATLALEVGPSDLGITTPLTFLASANCIEFCGGRTDFIDIDRDTLALSPEQLERYCKEVAIPKVVIIVDFAGIPANLRRVSELAKIYGFHIVRDAAHAIGSTFIDDGKELDVGCCKYSDLTTFSFHPVKTVTSGEGGAVLTNDDELAKKVRLFCSHGMERDSKLMSQCDGPWYYEMTYLGYNYRITDIQCALGFSQLQRIDHFKKRRLQIVEQYSSVFGNVEGLCIPPMPEGTSPCFHLYPLRFTDGKEKRAALYSALREKGIFCQVHYIPVYWQPYYRLKYGYDEGKCPVSEEFYNSMLSIPLYPSLTDQQVQYVIDTILQLHKRL